MDGWVKGAWFLLAAVHLPPAAVLVSPGLVGTLYGIDPDGPAGLLLVHRGALFLAVVAAALFAAFDPGARRVCTVVLGISMVGFLALYALAGMPDGSLRTIALVDAVALLPLAVVTAAAWRA